MENDGTLDLEFEPNDEELDVEKKDPVSPASSKSQSQSKSPSPRNDTNAAPPQEAPSPCSSRKSCCGCEAIDDNHSSHITHITSCKHTHQSNVKGRKYRRLPPGVFRNYQSSTCSECLSELGVISSYYMTESDIERWFEKNASSTDPCHVRQAYQIFSEQLESLDLNCNIPCVILSKRIAFLNWCLRYPVFNLDSAFKDHYGGERSDVVHTLLMAGVWNWSLVIDNMSVTENYLAFICALRRTECWNEVLDLFFTIAPATSYSSHFVEIFKLMISKPANKVLEKYLRGCGEHIDSPLWFGTYSHVITSLEKIMRSVPAEQIRPDFTAKVLNIWNRIHKALHNIENDSSLYDHLTSHLLIPDELATLIYSYATSGEILKQFCIQLQPKMDVLIRNLLESCDRSTLKITFGPFPQVSYSSGSHDLSIVLPSTKRTRGGFGNSNPFLTALHLGLKEHFGWIPKSGHNVRHYFASKIIMKDNWKQGGKKGIYDSSEDEETERESPDSDPDDALVTDGSRSLALSDDDDNGAF